MIKFISSGNFSASKNSNYLFKQKILFNQVLKSLNKNDYCSENFEFHFHVRLNGDIVTFPDPIGCSHLKYFKKSKKVGMTITLGDDQFESTQILETFLYHNLKEAIEWMVIRIEKEGLQIEKKLDMFEDFERELKDLFPNADTSSQY